MILFHFTISMAERRGLPGGGHSRTIISQSVTTVSDTEPDHASYDLISYHRGKIVVDEGRRSEPYPNSVKRRVPPPNK